MTAMELAGIAANMPYDAEIRFVCKCDSNPHDDYFEVGRAYLLQYQDGENPECALYLTGKE